MSLFTLALGAWGVVLAAFVAVIIWKARVGFSEEDVVVLDSQADKQEAEQRQLMARLQSLTLWEKRLGYSTLALTVLVGGIWMYQSLAMRYGG